MDVFPKSGFAVNYNVLVIVFFNTNPNGSFLALMDKSRDEVG